MSKYQFVLSAFLLANLSVLSGQDRLNVDLYINELLDDVRYSGSWYYVDENGEEYALLGAKSGTAIFQLIAEGESALVGFVEGPESNWREITVIGDHAYVTTEGGADTVGMHVIDLSPLPQAAPYLLTEYKETFGIGHIIQRDVYSQEPFVYVIGTQATDGVHILDVSDPAAPHEVGLYAPGYYIHDAHINGDLMFCAAFNQAQIDVVDISNKTQPTFLTSIEDPGINTHSSWLTEDKKYLFVADEADGFHATIFNVEDLDDIYQVAQYTANLESLVHNPYIRGDFAYISHNTEGLRVVDIADPTCPVEVGYYDTYDGPSGGFAGLWSACPFLPSGRIIGGDRTGGLFVWEFNETKAARIYGLVRSAGTQEPLADAEIHIPELDTTLIADSEGRYKIGFYPQQVTLSIHVPGYSPWMESIDFANGGNENVISNLELAVATNEISEPGGPRISPNPVGSEMILEFLNTTSLGTYIFQNANGREVHRLRIDQLGKRVVHAHNWPPGVYFLSGPEGFIRPVIKF